MRGFRAWHTKLGRYLKDNEFYINSKGSVCSAFETYDDEVRKADCVEDFSRDDFDEGYIIREDGTGLEDKNGKEIYEGDILGDIWEGGYIAWCDKCKQLQYHISTHECMACLGDVQWYELVNDNGKLEVIGNIHENPELLEGQEMKSQKKLDRFKLTEEEKKAIRKQERYESTIDSIILVLAIMAGLITLIAVMEIFG